MRYQLYLHDTSLLGNNVLCSPSEEDPDFLFRVAECPAPGALPSEVGEDITRGGI